MLIIISGCDRTGKSTIAAQLAKRLGAEYVHFSYPNNKEEAKKDYFDFIDKLDPNKNYICDRFYEGEYVYAPIYRGYQLDYSREIEQAIKAKTNVLFIYVYADLDCIKERILQCGEDYVKDEDIQKVVNNYKSFMKQLMLPYIIIYNNQLEDLIPNIELCLKSIKTADEICTLHRQNQIELPFGNLQALTFLVQVYNQPFDESILNIDDYNAFWFTYAVVEERETKLLNPREILPYGLFTT